MEHSASERTAAAIRAELARRNLRGTDLAAALGVSRATVWRRLRGDSPITIDELTAIAAFIGVPVATILGEPTD